MHCFGLHSILIVLVGVKDLSNKSIHKFSLSLSLSLSLYIYIYNLCSYKFFPLSSFVCLEEGYGEMAFMMEIIWEEQIVVQILSSLSNRIALFGFFFNWVLAIV